MKKVSAIAIAAALMLSMTACGSNQDVNTHI